jgi:hypothetical protein
VYLYLLFNIYNNSEKNRKGELKMRNIIMSFAEKFNGKEVKTMKSLLAIVIAITMALSTTGVSYASFDTDGSTTFEASITMAPGTGTVTVPYNAQLKNLSNDETGSTISWTGVTAGVTGWLAANQYIAVKGFATYSDWGIQVYTDNDDYTGTGSPAGLIRQDNKIYSLPMCWRTKIGYYDPLTGEPTDKGSEAISANELLINQGIFDGYTVLYDGVSGHEPGGTDQYFPWFFMLDKNTPDVDLTIPDDQEFGNYQQEATFMGSAGYHHAPGDVAANFATPSDPNDTYYVYLGAKFTLAVPGKTYSTDTLTVEMYHY